MNPAIQAPAPPEAARGKKFKVVIVASHLAKDHMMHATDMFEPWKVLIEDPVPISGTLKETETLSSAIPRMKTTIEASKKYRVIAIFTPYKEEGAWCDQSILTVSTGKQFCKFADYLEYFNYAGPMPRRYLEYTPA